MRVTIEHREEAAGVAGRKRHYFVDCTVAFSEEEKAIIKARGLYNESFHVRESKPDPSNLAILSTGLPAIGALVIIGSFIAGMAGVRFAAHMFALGIGLSIYGLWRRWSVGRRLNQTEQQITIKRLLSHPSFTVYADTPVLAQAYEDSIRDQLVSLKNQIAMSAEVPKARTFEL